VHCQIDPENSKRRIFLYEITPKKFPRVVSSNVRQTEIKNYAANGLGEGLDIVNKWMENFFGKPTKRFS
jgi:hypothetical protein